MGVRLGFLFELLMAGRYHVPTSLGKANAQCEAKPLKTPPRLSEDFHARPDCHCDLSSVGHIGRPIQKSYSGFLRWLALNQHCAWNRNRRLAMRWRLARRAESFLS